MILSLCKPIISQALASTRKRLSHHTHRLYISSLVISRFGTPPTTLKSDIKQNMALSRSSSSLTRTEVRSLRVAELKDELAARGLDTTGLKKDLLDRLLNDLSNITPSASASASAKYIQNYAREASKEPQQKSTGKPAKLVDMIDPTILYVLRYHGMQHHPSATASCGLILYNSETEKIVWSGAQFYSAGESAQEAEMKGLSSGLNHLSKVGIKKLIIQGHAKGSTANQLQGHFGVKSKHLQMLHQEIEDIMRTLEECETWGVAMDQVAKEHNLAKKSLENRNSKGFDLFQIEDEDESSNSENVSSGISSLGDMCTDEAERGLDPVEDYSQERQNTEQDNLVSLPSFAPDKKYVLRFDGGSRGNPGTAGAGMVLFDSESGLEVWAAFQYLDETTNNVAEYSALLYGLQFASAMGITQLVAEGDSTLVVKQVTGEFAVKKEHLKPLRQSVRALADRFDYFSINYIPRAENFRADQLANVAMDEKFSMGLEVLEYIEEADDVSFQSRSQHHNIDGVNDIKASSHELQSLECPSTLGLGNHYENVLPIPEADISERQLSPHRTYVLKFGGNAKGQSAAGCAAILLDDISNEEIWNGMYYINDQQGSQFIAGYTGLIIGLRKALSMGAKRLIVVGSTDFVVNQMAGKWKVKGEVIKPYHMHAKYLCDNYFEDIDFEFAKENGGGELRTLCNEAMESQKSRLQGFLPS